MLSQLAILAAFLISALGAIHIFVVGSLSLGEVVFLAILPIYIGGIVRAWNRRPVRVLFIMGLVYLVALVFADIYRDSLPSDYLRGWAKLGITLGSLMFFSALFESGRNVLVGYLLGAAIATFFGAYTNGGGYDLADVGFKYYYGPSLAMVAFLLLGYTRGGIQRIMRAILGLFVVLSIYENARSLAGVVFLTLIVEFSARRLFGDGRQGVQRGMIRGKAALVGGLLGVCSVLALVAYKVGAGRGWYGTAVQEKYEWQTQAGKQSAEGGNFSILSGRYEMLFVMPKIEESPFIGWGSWAKDTAYVYGRAQDLGLNAYSVAYYTDPTQTGLIPTHSHIMGGWLEAGILGGLFWLICFYKASKILLSGETTFGGTLGPVMCFMVLSFLWDLWFSPYGAERRVGDGFILAWLAMAEFSAGERHSTWLRRQLGLSIQVKDAARSDNNVTTAKMMP